MKQITIPCAFPNGTIPVELSIGDPQTGKNPLQFQSKWLSEMKGGNIPQDVLDSLMKLAEIANKHNIPLADLCEYGLQTAIPNHSSSDKEEKQEEEEEK